MSSAIDQLTVNASIKAVGARLVGLLDEINGMYDDLNLPGTGLQETVAEIPEETAADPSAVAPPSKTTVDASCGDTIKEYKKFMSGCKASHIKPLVAEFDQLVKLVKGISTRKAPKAPKAKMTDEEKKLKQEKALAKKAAKQAKKNSESGSDGETDTSAKEAKLAEKQAIKQAKLEAKQAKLAEKQAKLEAKEADKQAKEAKLAEKQAKLEAKEAEKQAKLAEKQAKIDAKEAAKQAKLEAKEAAKQAKKDEKAAAAAINLIADAAINPSEPKIARIPFPLPWDGVIVADNCRGLRVNRGLYTQCKNIPIDLTTDTKLCSICTKDFNGTTTKYGTVADRVAHDENAPMTAYAEPGNPKNTAKTFGDVVTKLGHEIADVKATLAESGIVLDEAHYAVTPKNRGRPSKNSVSAADHANMIEVEGHDLISKMIDSANAELVADLSPSTVDRVEVNWGGVDVAGNQLLVDDSGSVYVANTQNAGIEISDEIV